MIKTAKKTVLDLFQLLFEVENDRQLEDLDLDPLNFWEIHYED